MRVEIINPQKRNGQVKKTDEKTKRDVTTVNEEKELYNKDKLLNKTRRVAFVFIEQAHEKGEEDLPVNSKKKVVNSLNKVMPDSSKEKQKAIYIKHSE